jgi:DNA repair protein RadC
MQIKELVPYERYTLGDTRKRLAGAGYEIAYGSTYTLKDIRKAIIDKQPAFISIDGRTFLAVGENPDSLILHRRGQLREYADQQLRKAFTGEAVIVQGKPSIVAGNELVIFTPERDNWLGEWADQQHNAVRFIRGLQCGESWLPDHPVILTFRKPTPAQVKELIRASTIGIEITLYDPSDPVTEFLHELGHMYWTNRLTADEKKAFKDYQKTFKKDTVPPIYTSAYWWKNDEELFCTLYMFCVKARTVNSGYIRLMDLYEKQGRDLVEGIFSRVAAEQVNRQSWEAGLPILQECVERCLCKTYRIAGTGRILKASSPMGHVPGDIRFDRTVKHTVREKHKDIEWIDIEDGPLAGQEIVLKAGVVHPAMTKAIIRYRANNIKSIPGTLSKTLTQGRGPLSEITPENIQQEKEYVPHVGMFKAILQKAKNTGHLIKKVITNKIGRRQSVWVRPEDLQKPGIIKKQRDRHHVLPQEPSSQHIFEAHPGELDSSPLLPEAAKLKGELIASGINLNYEKEWTESNKISLLGQKIKDPADLAHLAQVYRNPQFETMRIFMLNNKNKVVLETGVSCRLPGTAAAFIHPKDQVASIIDMKMKMQASGAMQYYIMHNHPSGQPQPSLNDSLVTNFYRKNLSGFKGHVIIDHDQYALIDEQGRKSSMTVDPTMRRGAEYLTPSHAHAAIGEHITGPPDLVNIVKKHQLLKDFFVTLIGASIGRVRGIINIPAATFLGDGKIGLQQAHEFSVKVGAIDMFAVGLDEGDATATAIKTGIEQGYFRDIVTRDGNSMLESGKYRKNPDYDSGLNALEVAQVHERGGHMTKARLVRRLDGTLILLKAKDRSRLQKKVITNKLGYQQTVYVAPPDANQEGRQHHGSTRGGGAGERGHGNNLNTFIHDAITGPGGQKTTYDIGTVDAKENEKFTKIGLDCQGYTHRLENYGLRHMLQEHGNPKRETRRRQIAVTIDDLKKIPDIIHNPDGMSKSKKTSLGNEVIIYNKQYNGTVYYLEEVRTGNKTLTSKTMYIKKRGRADVAMTPQPLTSETPPPSKNKDIKKGNESQENNLSIIKATTYEDLADLLQDVDTDPSPAQKEAGNYKKASFSWNGLKITIENPAGSMRSGIGSDGEPWETDVYHHYGYVNRSEGADGDHVDVFIGPAMDTADTVYVVHQVDPESGDFNEHKCMIGFNAQDEAQDAYLKHYPEGWRGMGEVVPLPVDDFATWLQEGDTTEPTPRYKQMFQKAKNMISKKIILPALTSLVIVEAVTHSKYTL